ncbi:hypothetical protein OTU49_000879 [Cherax quadricarinatus]|uniref:Uncharacterized protein n=2 Tax=Cherax quadricarinatus TaxID=27406 RepID=A0AAW0YPF3_CHEQU|nr:uncharacterized protein LOC128695220 isoform X1 [Cherax quadricarinatus]
MFVVVGPCAQHCGLPAAYHLHPSLTTFSHYILSCAYCHAECFEQQRKCLFTACSGMASVPQTLHITKTQRQQQRRGAGLNTAHECYFDNAELEQPMRYSSKLMNSIWGQYNKNSVHNFKSLQCGGVAAPDTQEVQLQQAPPTTREVLQQRLEELGKAVATNYMDNLHQY